MKGTIIALIIGVILLGIGGWQNVQYEDNSITVEAIITDIKTVDNTDDGPISYKHTYYGDYTINGTDYTDKKLATKYNSSHIPNDHVGDTMDVVVSADNPGDLLSDGGGFLVLGMVITAIAGWKLYKSRKNAA